MPLPQRPTKWLNRDAIRTILASEFARISDALCRLASGGSLLVRQLYTDDTEVLFQAARPALLNGIEDVIGRPDLADRAIFLTLPPIGEKERRPKGANSTARTVRFERMLYVLHAFQDEVHQRRSDIAAPPRPE